MLYREYSDRTMIRSMRCIDVMTRTSLTILREHKRRLITQVKRRK